MKETALHKKLAAELISLIPALDEEGLSFLVEQARVHLYNMEIIRDEELSVKAGKIDGKTAPAPKNKDKSEANFRVERSSSGSSYHLISGGKWKMYTDTEMLDIVRIAQAKESIAEVAARLYHWFEEERADTFADLEIADAHDPKMKELVVFLRKKFNVKKN